MSDISLRAYDLDNNKMYYDVIIAKLSIYKSCSYDKESNYYNFSDDNEIKNAKVMQYVGRKDINDKKIYESDIVEFTDKGLIRKGVVEFKDCSFVIKNDNGIYYKWINYEVKILGNIYENPELKAII